MCVITEYDEAETLKAIGEEKYAEGFAVGYAEGLAEAREERRAAFKAQLDIMIKDGRISEETAQMIIDGANSQDQ